MTARRSPSSARIGGDDYQHLFAWWQALGAVIGSSDITKIGIEDPRAGNADDVTVYRKGGRRECYQVKYSVNASNPVGLAWLMGSSKSGGPSMIQRFHSLWADEQDGCRLKITLVTNRLPIAGDLLSTRDNCDGTIVRHLQDAGPRSKFGSDRCKLTEHLGITESEVVRFFCDLRFVLGKDKGDLTDLVKDRMYTAGLRYDEDAVALGMAIVRGWVTRGKREITTVELRKEVERLKRPADPPTASILVQAIDRDPNPEDATVALDWFDSFPGGEPRARHQPSDSTLWNDRFRPELRQAAQYLRSQGHAHVLVKGYMRLPTWFAVGVELGKTAGFEVSSIQGQTDWSSIGGVSGIDTERAVTTLGLGRDLALGIALATDPSPDVLTYLRDQQISVGEYVCISPTSGANNQAIGNAAEARGWAYNVRDSVRHLVQDNRPDQIHLFLACPHGAMLLLGHLWDHMPSTQLYESLNSPKGYIPSYLIPS